ncbi:MAG: dinitrogenase iron-molybdenum cofactor biosynthesis protein [SAR324 cluster bacterium]|uniref:Dinitrogenase iron-molybdenum cofactor biosynthesis protein n=1 Tax=SAR324 cluster bacterium TaxID=2024889 RepID=A0A7X9FNZ7_9DELT|nr:dinitrogenase iron-molybdenum cofactor biosynthesis protein [SAR324 cluster bacterium]
MKIAFTSSGDNLRAPLNPHFGRAPKFLIYDLENGDFEIIDNRQNLNAVQGAGIQSAETVSASKVGAVVTGHCGPKAFQALNLAGIKVFHTDSETIAEAIEKYKSGALVEATIEDSERH